jgi:uncharacterized membrane protein
MLRRPLARAVVASAVFLFSWSFLYVGVFARDYAKLISDVNVYQAAGDLVRHGSIPYRDFALEYPPGSLPAFIAPAWASDYGLVFGILMMLCGLAMVFLVGLAAPGWAGPLFASVSPFLIGDLMRARFDLWPAALAAAAMLALLRDRHRLGWALLGAAVAAKGYAICVVPLAVVWTARRVGRPELARAAAWGGGVLLVTFLPFFAVAPHGMWVSIWGQVSRPIQIESLGGAILLWAREGAIHTTHGSANVFGTTARLVTAGFGVAELLALLWCWLRFARGNPDAERFCRFAAASAVAFVAFGKVISPQYLIWLVPFVALVKGRRGLAAMGLLAAACLLTYVWIPSHYSEYKDEHRAVWAVVSRDGVLVLLFALLAWPRGARGVERPAVEAPAR